MKPKKAALLNKGAPLFWEAYNVISTVLDLLIEIV